MAKPVKPTPKESAIIFRRLKKLYPQMYKPGWGSSKKASAETPAKKPKPVKDTARTQAITSKLKNAGLDQATIDRLRGKK